MGVQPMTQNMLYQEIADILAGHTRKLTTDLHLAATVALVREAYELLNDPACDLDQRDWTRAARSVLGYGASR